MLARDNDTNPPDRGGFVFYVSLSLLIAVIGYAMMILPQRG
ncbi:MAG: hypothetical protein ACJ74Y_07510 [Bryobacteraceae bacterium]